MKKRKLLQLMLIVCFAMMFLAAAGWVVLFQVNSFSLVMQLMGEPEVLVYQGEMYTDPGADVKLVGTKFFCDGIDLDISPEISGNVDVNRPGYYEIIYTASFMSWDASASRTVRVVDTVPPSITLKSVPGHYTNFGEPYQEEGYSAWDEIDGDLTEQVTCREEDGYVVYSVEDQSGNCTMWPEKFIMWT